MFVARFGFRHGATEDDVFDFVFGDLRMLFQKAADDRTGEIVRARSAQRAARRFADGGAETVDDDGFLHELLWWD